AAVVPLETLLDELLDGEIARRLGRAASFEIALHVLPQNIALEIDGIAEFEVAHISVLIGEGDDGDFGDAIVPARHGEADAVDGDGALGNDVARERFWHFHAVPPVLAFGFQASDAANRVHVAQNKVAAKLLASGHGLFEINAHARPQFAEGGLADGLAR